MAHDFLRLRLRLLANSLKRSPWQLGGMILALLYGLGTAVLVVAGLLALRFVDLEVARPVAVVFGSLVVLVFTVLPLLLGIDDTLDPRKFALFGMSNNRLALGLGLASFVSVPAIVITIIALALIGTWSRTPAAAALAVVSAILIVVTCVMSARVATSVAALLLSTRRARDTMGVVGIIVLVCFVPGIVALANADWQRDAISVFTHLERVMGWTPLGAAWAIPADAAAGDLAGSLAKLGVAVAWAIVLVLVWRLLVGVLLVTPSRQPVARRYVGLGWFDRLPARPAGVIAARNLTYWSRDARYGTSLAIIPVIPLVMVIALSIAGVPLHWLALLPVPVMSLFLAWLVHNDVSFDNTAIWVHLASSTSGLSDRWGRLVPVLFVGIPVIVVGSILSAWGHHDFAVLPALLGVSSCILLSGLGLSSVTSAAFPYAAVRPGESPFSQPNAGASPAGLIQALSFGAIILLSAPAAVFAVLGFTVSPVWFGLSCATGLVVGVAVLFAGVGVGARVYERRGPELLEAAVRN